jgi:colanic acid biosynthesis glycosyl transferase WcaI
VKILYVSQYFPPEMGAPSARASELAHHWVQAGHEVSVLTGFPNHPTGEVPAEWCARLRRLIFNEQIEGVNVFRTWLWPLPNRKAHERIRNYASFWLSSSLRGMALSRHDVIIATSPQLLVGLTGWWLSRVKNAPFVFEVRDLWPESLTAVGVGDDNSFLHHSLAAIARFLYDHSDHIVVVTEAFKDHLISRWRVASKKISVVENGVETDLFQPSEPAERNSLRVQLGADGRFLVCYVGTMGMAHGLETLLAAAAELRRQRSNVMFLLIGEGAEKDRIKALAHSQGLDNVRFLDQQPREKIPAFISASDACLVLLKKTDVFKTVIPTKMLEFMSCARPVILGVEGQAQQILEAAGGGVVIEPENPHALVKAISMLEANPALCADLGQKGRAFILRNFSRAQKALHYIKVLERLLGKDDRPDQS